MKQILTICNKLTDAGITYKSGNVLQEEREQVNFNVKMPVIGVLQYLPENKLEAMCEVDYTQFKDFSDVTQFWSANGYLKCEPYMIGDRVPIFYIRHNQFLQFINGNFVITETKCGSGLVYSSAISIMALTKNDHLHSYIGRSKLAVLWAFSNLVEVCCYNKDMLSILKDDAYALYNFMNKSLLANNVHIVYELSDLSELVSCRRGNIPDYRNIYKIKDKSGRMVYVAYGHDSIQIEYKMRNCPSHTLTVTIPTFADCKDVDTTTEDFIRFKYKFFSLVKYENILRSVLLGALRYIGVDLDYSGIDMSTRIDKYYHRNAPIVKELMDVRDLLHTEPDMF